MEAEHLIGMFDPLLGTPCWGVRWDSQTNLNLEFGEPHLEIKEPDPSGRSVTSPYRWVSIEGEWGLWVFCAHWKLSGLLDMDPVTSSSSDKRIRMGAARLDGQRLTAVSITARNAFTRLTFDLGAVLEIRRFGPNDDGPMWTLRMPDGMYLQVRGSGEFTYESGHCKDHVWQRMDARA